MQIEKLTPKYSLKNIPVPGKHEFVLSLTDKIVDFIKRMRPLSSQPCSPKRGTKARRKKIEVAEDTTKQQRTGPVRKWPIRYNSEDWIHEL